VRVLRWAGPALLLMVAAILITEGTGAAGLREATRWTARTSLLLFSLAFASWGLASTSWPARNRAGLLAALALSHGLHLLAIGALALATGGENVAHSPLSRLLGGMAAYAVIFLGAWRPAAAAVKWGAFWVWLVFLIAYLPRAVESPAGFGPAVAILGLALAVRVAGALLPARPGMEPDLP
jgi:hypothetical protein